MKNQTGVILFVDKFPECVDFYENKIQIPIQMRKEGIVRFSFGPMYLQIEDVRVFNSKPSKNVIIRVNSDNVKAIQEKFNLSGVHLEYYDFEWGEIANVLDPSGNKLEYFREK
jgi:lactoylglutathione lyase